MFFQIRQALEHALLYNSREARRATGSPLVFAHLCLGSLTASAKSPYDGLRITEIAATKGARFPIAAVSSNHHSAAFRRHINRFGRSATFLDWLTRRLYHDFSLHDGGMAVPTSHIEVLVSPERAAFALNRNVVKLSRLFFETIVAPSVVRPYFNGLYDQHELQDAFGNVSPALSYHADQFMGLRFAAQRLVQANGAVVSLRRLSRPYQDRAGNAHRPANEWKFLGALQTALMYVWAAQGDNDDPGGFVTVGACYRIKNVAANKCPLGLFSAVLPPRCGDEQRSKIIDVLGEILRTRMSLEVNSASYHRDRGDLPRVGHRTTKSWTPDRIESAVTKELRNAFPTKWFQRWRASLMVWLSLIAERLREKVHEGQPLNFSFVVADRSEVGDSGLFEVIPLKLDDGARLVPLNDDGNAENLRTTDALLETALREIEKKNYSWFLGGKYALLWDASFPSKHPQYLIRLKDSSWEVFQNHIRLGKESRASDVVRAMVFVSTDGSGGMVLSGKQVVSFRKGQDWSEESSKRETRLRRYLRRHIGKWVLDRSLDRRTVKSVAEALLAISDDPHAGCMLVVFEKDKMPTFEPMGEVWETSHGGNFLEMSRDVITSLMAMDGATCLFLKNAKPHMEFRRLATAPDKANRPLHIMARKKLDGAGSRKWSAANAAKRREVAIIISVSQDGPIHIYEAKDGKVQIGEL